MKRDLVCERLPATKLRKGLFAFREDEVPSEALAVLALEPEDLGARLGLHFDDSFDGRDSLKLCLLRLPSQRKVALIRHLHAPVPGTLVAVQPGDVEDPAVLAEVRDALGLESQDVRWTRMGDTTTDRTRAERRSGLLTKRGFVDQVASKSGLTRRDAAKAVDAFLDAITDALKSGETVNFPGFGKFSTQYRTARRGFNPRHPGEKVHIPAANLPKFSPASDLKASVSKRSRA